MAQEKIWENEYRNSKLMTKGDKPQSDTLDFLKYLTKEQHISLDGKTVLDLGCGTGRNSNYLAELGCKVTGIEISTTALRLGIERAKELHLDVSYLKGSIGEPLPFADATFDILLDVTSSNSLNEQERAVFITECKRVLKPGGYFFTKALCKDGDKNAKNLIKQFPGKEYDTYVMPEIGLTERVWSENDFKKFYSPHFSIERLEKKTNYSRFNNQSYKRNFWLAYLKK